MDGRMYAMRSGKKNNNLKTSNQPAMKKLTAEGTSTLKVPGNMGKGQRANEDVDDEISFQQPPSPPGLRSHTRPNRQSLHIYKHFAYPLQSNLFDLTAHAKNTFSMAWSQAVARSSRTPCHVSSRLTSLHACNKTTSSRARTQQSNKATPTVTKEGDTPTGARPLHSEQADEARRVAG